MCKCLLKEKCPYGGVSGGLPIPSSYENGMHKLCFMRASL